MVHESELRIATETHHSLQAVIILSTSDDLLVSLKVLDGCLSQDLPLLDFLLIVRWH